MGNGTMTANERHDAATRSAAVLGAPPRQYLFWWGVLLLAVGGVLGAGMMGFLRPATDATAGEARRNAQPLPVFGEVSDFTLTERSGRTVTKDDLEGRVWVADFFFTSCASICPIMSGAMARLQQQVRDNREVTLVSISVDPERDAPERLGEYAARYDADPVRWWFLTGEKRVIYRLSHESFRLSVEEIPEARREPDMEPVLHSSKFVLLDRQGRIRGYYDGEVAETVDLLAEDIERLLGE